MSAPVILFVGAIYLVVCLDNLRTGRPGMALAWFGYALANCGLAWDFFKGGR